MTFEEKIEQYGDFRAREAAKKAAKEAAKEAASKMKADGLSPEIIAKYTNLTLEEIKQL